MADIFREQQKTMEARKDIEGALKEKAESEQDLESKSLGVRKRVKECHHEEENQDRSDCEEIHAHEMLKNGVRINADEIKRIENAIEELCYEYACKGQAYETYRGPTLSTFWTLLNQNQICEDVDEEIHQVESRVSGIAVKLADMSRGIDEVTSQLEANEDLGLSLVDASYIA